MTLTHHPRSVFFIVDSQHDTSLTLWAGVSNYVTGGHNRHDKFSSSSPLAASKMGHSSLTHAVTYSSQQVGVEEAHFNGYHFAIGDASYLISKSLTMLSLANLHAAMQLWFPTSASFGNGHENYLLLQQKELVEFGYSADFHNKPHHCLALLAPGDGKSEC